MEPTTIQMMSGDGIVTVEAVASGIAGLVLAPASAPGWWVLVHAASGRTVSRSARHCDPEVLRGLAQRLAPLTDWTQRTIAVPGPVLRREVDLALEKTGMSMPNRSTAGPVRPWTAEEDRALLTRVVRKVHTAMPAGMFADAIGDLDTAQRAHLRALLIDEGADTGAVLTSLPTGGAQPPEGPRPSVAPGDLTETLPPVSARR